MTNRLDAFTFVGLFTWRYDWGGRRTTDSTSE